MSTPYDPSRIKTADKRALRILFDTYWSPGGWKPKAQQVATPEDFAYAKSCNVMFDPVELDHAQALERLLGSISELSKRKVANAFLASLSTRRLDWRSALGSYAVFQHLFTHEPQLEQQRCVLCGFYLKEKKHDFNVLNFERFKLGGVRHLDLIYAAMDLALFLEDIIPEPTLADIQIFRSVVSAIEAAPVNVTGAALQSELGASLKSNKAERDVVVAILGYCGILDTPGHPAFSDAFIPINQRELPGTHFQDMPYPACWWKRANGINRTRLAEYFGHVL